jgi:hypothetical protein
MDSTIAFIERAYGEWVHYHTTERKIQPLQEFCAAHSSELIKFCEFLTGVTYVQPMVSPITNMPAWTSGGPIAKEFLARALLNVFTRMRVCDMSHTPTVKEFFANASPSPQANIARYTLLELLDDPLIAHGPKVRGTHIEDILLKTYPDDFIVALKIIQRWDQEETPDDDIRIRFMLDSWSTRPPLDKPTVWRRIQSKYERPVRDKAHAVQTAFRDNRHRLKEQFPGCQISIEAEDHYGGYIVVYLRRSDPDPFPHMQTVWVDDFEVNIHFYPDYRPESCCS